MNLTNMMSGRSWKSDQRFLDADAKNFSLIFFGLIVGIIAGTVGSVFRLILLSLDEWRDGLFGAVEKAGITGYFFPILFCVAGIAIAIFLVNRFAPETSGSGVHEIEGALDEILTIRWKRVLPIKFIGSLFSLGSGLLLGREGPTIQIGASLGKMTHDLFRQDSEKTNFFISAGAAAGLASAFNAPLAGIIFVIEEMHGHFRYTFFTLSAIMVASGTADLVVRLLIGADPVIKMTIFANPDLSSIWWFVLLGLLLSVIGFAFNKLLVFLLDFFGKLSKLKMVLYFLAVGLIVALVGIYNPNFIGGGYNTIRVVIDQSNTIRFLFILFAARLVLTVLSYSTGVPGGIFAPLLAIGIAFGMMYGNLLQYLLPESISHPGVFALAGMAGIFASTVRAPLTGLVLAVEMTSNYEMILPLIMTTVTASVVTAQLGNQPIYTTLLKRLRDSRRPNQQV